jgi:hypothetical protein
MVAVKKRKSQLAKNRTPITRSSPQTLYRLESSGFMKEEKEERRKSRW